MKLYEITQQHRELEKLAQSDDGELAEALNDTFNALSGEFEDKATSLITVVHNMDSNIEAIKLEVDRLNARKKTIENAQNSMREYLRTNMESTGISKIECPLFSITLAKGRDVVEVIDEEKIPVDFIAFKTSKSPMKKEILAALKAGESIEGVQLGKSKTSLRIK